MATSATTTNQTALSRCKCPVCGMAVKETDLGRAGITRTEMDIVRRHIRDRTFGKLVQLLDVVMGKLDPEKMNRDLQTKNAMAEILRALDGHGLESKKGAEEALQILNEIRLKLSGPGIGKVGEMIALKDFKAATPGDDFSEEKADKHGTDIVATVRENEAAIGKVAISVKFESHWKSDFLRQLQENMNQETTDFGILATNAMPKDALNNKVMMVKTASDGLILVANQDSASVAYQGVRQCVIAWDKARKSIHEAQQRIDEKSKVFKAVSQWINGNQFREAMGYVDVCSHLSEETNEVAVQIRETTIKKVKAMIELQQELRNNLGYAKEAIEQLKRLLNGDDGGKGTSSSPLF